MARAQFESVVLFWWGMEREVNPRTGELCHCSGVRKGLQTAEMSADRRGKGGEG